MRWKFTLLFPFSFFFGLYGIPMKFPPQYPPFGCEPKNFTVFVVGTDIFPSPMLLLCWGELRRRLLRPIKGRPYSQKLPTSITPLVFLLHPLESFNLAEVTDRILEREFPLHLGFCAEAQHSPLTFLKYPLPFSFFQMVDREASVFH